jgi:hypothetical protein
MSAQADAEARVGECFRNDRTDFAVRWLDQPLSDPQR